jgi:hypothetical protein
MSKLGKIVKDTIKTKKESVMGKLGDAPYEDPMEPWSGKYAAPVKNEEVEELAEDSILYRYIRSKGYSPEHMDFAHRSAFARSNAFKTYKVMHQNKKKVATGGIHDIKKPVTTEGFETSAPLNTPTKAGKDAAKKEVNRQADADAMSKAKIAGAVSENVENLDELNKDTVKSYSHKAAYDVAVQDANKKKIITGKTSASAPFVAKALEKPVRKMHNRLQGIVRASERLKKEEVETIDEAGVGKLMNFIKAKGLDPTSMDGNHKKHYSRSSEYRVFKTVHPDPDEARAKHKERTEKKKPKKKLNEISASGEGGDDWNDKFTDEPFVKVKAKKKLKESVDQKDTVTMDIPLLIRVLEYAREDAKDDMALHKVVENLISMRGKGVMTMDMYNKIVAIKESIEEADEAKYGKSYQDMVKRVGQKAAQKPVDMKSLAARMQASYAKEKKPLKELKKMPDNMDADDHITREEVEQIDELSKGTLKAYSKKRGETIHADKRDSNSARNKAADLQYHGKDKEADDWHDEADWLHQRARKGATNVAKATIKIAKKTNEEVVEEGIGGIEDSPMSATNSVKAMESDCSCDTRKQQAMKSARMIKSLYKKKLKESTYDWEKDDKGNKAPTAKIVVKGGKTMTGKDRDTVEIEPVLKTRPNSAKGMKPGV